MSHCCRRSFIALLAFAVPAGCSRSSQQPAPPLVHVIRVAPATANLTTDFVGQVIPFRQVELRSQTTGVVRRRLFAGGERVPQGQLLLTIETGPYESNAASARANLAEAEATLAQARGDVARYQPLVQERAIAEQVYDTAVATAERAGALLDARRAVLRQAERDLANTQIRAPIGGVVDVPLVDVGSLVTAGQTVLATISATDSVYAEFSVPETTYVRFMAQSPQSPPRAVGPVTLVLPDGSEYARTGSIQTVSRSIAATGTLTIRAVFPNPSNVLRPGLNIRVRIPVLDNEEAILIPQRAVGDLLGRKYVYVIGEGNLVEQRMLELGATVGDRQIVMSGLQSGETIIVDGLQAARPGQAVTPQPAPAREPPANEPAGAQAPG